MSQGQQHATEDDQRRMAGGRKSCCHHSPHRWSSSIACCWPWLISLVYGSGLLFRGPFCIYKTGVRWHKKCCRGKAISISYSGSIICNISQVAKKKHALYFIVVCGLPGLGTIFGRVLLNVKRVFWIFIQLLSEIFLIIRGTERETTLNLHRSSLNYWLFLLDFNKNWIFLTYFRKIFKYKILWKSIQWEASCSMRTDAQTDGQT